MMLPFHHKQTGIRVLKKVKLKYSVPVVGMIERRSHCKPISTKYTTIVKCVCKHNKDVPVISYLYFFCCGGNIGLFPSGFTHWQQHVAKSVCFANDLGENILYGPRTVVEYFLLYRMHSQALPPERN